MNDTISAKALSYSGRTCANVFGDYLLARTTFDHGDLAPEAVHLAQMDNARLIDLACAVNRAPGGIEGAELFRQLTTSDFPDTLVNGLSRPLLLSYGAASAEHEAVLADVPVPNLKTITLPVVDVGELTGPYSGAGTSPITNALMNIDAGVEAKPYTYGARLTIARESLVNDDVGLLTRAMNELGALAARKEAALVAAVLAANANLGDSDTLFNTDNSVTGDLDVSGLDAAFAALRQQPTGGGHYANLSPGVLLVPPDEVMTAELLMQSMRNPPRLISNAWLASGTRYVFASPRIAPTLVRLRLAGDRPGPVISKALSRGDTGDGVEVMFFHDVGITAGSRVGVVRLASA